MKRRFLAMTAALAAMTGASGASGDELRTALAQVYQENPNILAERIGLRIANEGYAQARSIVLPSLTASASYGKRETDETGSAFASDEDLEPSSVALRASQNIYTGGRFPAASKQANANILSARERLQQVTQETLLSGVSAYVGVLTQSEIVEIRRQSVLALTEAAEATRARFEAGELTVTDVELAESRAASARADLAAAQSQLRAARANYERVFGFPPLELEPLPELPPLPASEDDAVSTALQWNPELSRIRFDEEASRAAADVARSDLRPTLSVDGTISRREQINTESFQEDAVEVTATVSWPIFRGGLERSQVRQAEQRVNQQRLLLRNGERFIIEAARREWAQWTASREIVDSSEISVRAAQTALDGVTEEVAFGQRTTIDLLNTELQLRNAQIRYAQARQERYLAAYRLLGAMGLLTADYLELPVPEFDMDRDLEAVKRTFLATSIKP